MTRILVLLLACLFTHGPALAQTAPITRIAFGSCADEEKPQPIWDAVLAYHPELFIFAGDNVYGDVKDGKTLPDAELIDGLRSSYARAKDVPGFMAVKQRISHLAVWDDHDYGKNDAGAEYAGKQEAKNLFLDFWNVPLDDQRRTREGLYHSETVGSPGKRVQIILLDTRYFRSTLKPTDQPLAPGKERYIPDDDPGKTMLGDAQWAWLEARLREPADIRLIVSSIQVLADGHGFERWGNLSRERQRLYDLIDRTRAQGVVFLSGDRHIAGLYRETRSVPYPLIEITSSGLTQTFPNNREEGPNRLGGIYGAVNFGTIDIDWWEKTLQISVRGLNGESVRRHSVSFDELQPVGR